MRRHRAQGHGAKSKRIRATKRQAAELMEIAARSIQGGKQLLLNLNNAWTLRGTRHRVYSPVRFTLTFRNRRRTSSLLPSNSSPKPNAMAITNWYVGVAKGGGVQRAMPSTLSAYLVILCFERRYHKQNNCCSPKIKHFAPRVFFWTSTILGWLRHWTERPEMMRVSRCHA